MLYDETQLAACYEKIETVDYHQEMNVDGIKFTGYNAGHVLGAAMFLIEIAGIKVNTLGRRLCAEIMMKHDFGTLSQRTNDLC